ncbi:flagellar hook-length control protein FliK [Pinirhizobacter sp.]|jgi:flagellar hook-length control protein FliK|uniref:flagellar hook-length control protein FliK n=1 Tax=Pinirhizobacter sp. TaxID=2950432 RepID=UPI002F3EEC66
MNTQTPSSIQLNPPQRASTRQSASTPDRDDAPSFGDAMKHASSALAPKADPPQHSAPVRTQDDTTGQAQSQAQAPQQGGGAHHAKAKGDRADAGDAADATAADGTGGVAVALADAASAAAQNPGPGADADEEPAADAKTAKSDQTSGPAQPATDPANGQAIAAAMLALIQQSAAPAPAATTAAAPATTSATATMVTATNDSKSAIADDIGAAITASSKMAQALTSSLGGAVAGTVADAATGVVGKAVGLVGDAMAGLLGSGDKADATKASLLPDPSLLATGQVPQASIPVSAPAALQSTQVAGTPAFANELGQQIAWMSNGDIKEASIRLHPEDMGQLDVKISVHQNRVDVAFAAQHPAAVQAVNQTLTQLDTMLAHHGLQLGQAQVGQQQSGQGGQDHGRSFAQVAQGSGEPGDVPDVQQATVRAPNALVDDFA